MMKTVKEVSEITGVTIRTLRYWVIKAHTINRCRLSAL